MSSKKSVFLDVDPKILERSLLIKEDSGDVGDFESFLRSQQNFSKDDSPWKLATTTAGLCVKTTDSGNKKVFINLCKLDDIPEPKEISEQELLELWQSEDATDYRVPISIQDPHDELDKSGKPSVVYDVAVNTNFFKKLETNMIFRGFVMQVVMEGLENKYNIELKKEGYIILKNRTCLGELRPHRIRLQKGPYKPPKRLIEEVSSTNNISGSGDMAVQQRKREAEEDDNVPEYHLYQKPDGVLMGEFRLPSIVSAKDIALDIGEDRIVLECRRGGYFLDLFLPLSVNEELASAQLNKATRILTVTMPTIIPAC